MEKKKNLTLAEKIVQGKYAPVMQDASAKKKNPASGAAGSGSASGLRSSQVLNRGPQAPAGAAGSPKNAP